MAHGSGSSTASVDFASLLYRVDGDQDLACELLLLFQEEIPSLTRDLREAIAARDLGRVETSAHTLKGMLANLSVTQALVIAARLELAARERRTAGMDEALLEFEEKLRDAGHAINAYLATAHPA